MEKKPDLMKTSILNPNKDTKVIMASDGDFQWIYNSESKTVFKTEISDDFNDLKLFEPNVYAEFVNGIILNGKLPSSSGPRTSMGKTYMYLSLPLPRKTNRSNGNQKSGLTEKTGCSSGVNYMTMKEILILR